uniref:Uncharacterized protein n=1 Tax=Ectopseudomonas oleovorans TaxID=301 RepID=A0A653BCY9_ECTOL
MPCPRNLRRIGAQAEQAPQRLTTLHKREQRAGTAHPQTF